MTLVLVLKARPGSLRMDLVVAEFSKWKIPNGKSVLQGAPQLGADSRSLVESSLLAELSLVGATLFKSQMVKTFVLTS